MYCKRDVVSTHLAGVGRKVGLLFHVGFDCLLRRYQKTLTGVDSCPINLLVI
jgi:hypothetical protein